MSLMSMFPGGGGTQNQPLKAPTNLHAEMNTVTSVAITWTDPENEYAQPSGILIGEWMFTRIVRKEGSAPVNANDGILIVESAVKNQYQTTPFVDTNGIVTGKTYYYAAFAFTTSRVSSPAATYQIVATWYDPVLNNNSWTMIYQACVEGVAGEIWSKGDTKTDNGVSFTLEMINPTNVCPLSDGSGYPYMVFVTTNCVAEYRYHSDNTSRYSYIDSDLETYISGRYNSLSEELKPYIQEVNMPYRPADYTNVNDIATYPLKTFALGRSLASILPTASSRIKKYGRETNTWWTGEPAAGRDQNGVNSYYGADYVSTDGSISSYVNNSYNYNSMTWGVVYGFAFGKKVTS